MVVYIKASFPEIPKMKGPGIGNKKRKFKQLLGWGDERATVKQLTRSRQKLSRKLRSRRTKPSKDNSTNTSRRKSRRSKK